MDLMELVVKISAESSSFDSAIKSAEGSASSFHDTAISKIGGGLKAAATMGVAAIGAAATAIGALTAKAVAGYSEYQQMEGGIKKLYGNMGMSLEEYAKSVGQSTEKVKDKWQSLEKAQNMVLQNASKAYATAGMSANQYMEAATSFSASLISSLGGDTVEAARLTDAAMTAMSDNWNTFGGNLNAIQGTFQSLARGNYAMLDNLKLGYGGTKAELERLISDASTYTEEQEKMNMTVDKGSMSFDNIVKAISVVQEHQNIAGTTARESTETIGGSLNMLQAAWQNLVDGFANPDADIGELIDNVMTALVGSTDEAGNHVKGFVDNVLPAVETAVESIASALAERLPEALSTLGSIFADIAPELIAAAIEAVGQVVAALPSILAGIGQAIIDTLSNIDFGSIDLEQKLRDFLVEHFGSTDFRDVAETIGHKLEQAFRDALVETFGTTDLSDAAESIGNALKDALSDLSDVIEVGGEIVDGIIQDISEHAPEMIEAATAIITALEEGLGEVSVSTIDVGGNIIASLIEGLQSNGGEIATAAGEIIVNLCNALMEAGTAAMEAGAEIVRALSEGFNNNATDIAAAAGQIVADLVVGFVEHRQDFYTAAGELVLALAEGLATAIPTALEAIGVFIYEALNGLLGAAWEATGGKIVAALGKNVPDGLKKISDTFSKGADDARKKFEKSDFAGTGKKSSKALSDNFSTKDLESKAEKGGKNVKNAIDKIDVASAIRKKSKETADGFDTAPLEKKASEGAKKAKSGVEKGDFKGAGQKGGKDTVEGFKSGIEAIKAAATQAAHGVQQAFSSQNWSGVGSNISAGIASGISAGGSAVISAAVSVATSAYQAACSALAIKSPSRKMKWVGEMFTKGMAEGVTELTGEAENAGVGVADAMYNSVNEELEIHSPSRKGAKIGANLVKGISKGVKDSEKEAVKKVEETAGKVLDAASKILEHYEISHHNMRMEKRLNIEISYWKNALKHVKHGTDAYYEMLKNYHDALDAMEEYRSEKRQKEREKSIAKAITNVGKVVANAKNAAAAVVKASKGMYSELNSNAQKWLENYKVYHNTTLKWEMDYWNKIRKAYKEGTQARIDADKQYFESKAKFNDAKSNAKKDAQKITEEYAKKYADIEQARDKKIEKAKETQLEKIASLHKKYDDSVDKLDQDLQKKISDRNEKLKDDIDKLTDSYQKSVESRAKSIMGMTKLFDKVKYDKTYSKDYLLETISEQVQAYEDWDAQLDALQDKLGSENPLFKALQEMGVSSLYTLKEINAMTADELDSYANLYQQKSDIATARATQESEGLLAQTQKDIEALRSKAAEDIQGYRSDFADARDTLYTTLRDEIKGVNEEYVTAANEARREAGEQMKALTVQYIADIKELASKCKAEGVEVGKSMIDGMQAGINNSREILAAAARSAAQYALAQAKAELGIQSPSKKFKEVGKFVDLGFAEGIEDNKQAIQRAIDNIISMPDAVTRNAIRVDSDSNRMGGGFVQNLTVNAPEALRPSEIARQTRLANQQMVLALSGV